jgi:hypothetical protein
VVIESISRTHAVRAIDGVIFQEDNFFVNRERTAKVLAYLATLEGVGWKANGRINEFARDSCDGSFFQSLVASSCSVLQFGVESGSQAVLDRIGKRITIEQVRQVNKVISDWPIRVRYNFIVGFPGETDQDRRATFSLIEELRSENANVEPPFLNIYSPCPGTPLYEEAIGLGFREPRDVEDWRSLTWSSGVTLPWLTQPEISELQGKVQQFTAESLYLQ